MQPLPKDEMLAELSQMLRDLFEEHERGAAGHGLGRAHGYLDGYMQAMIDSNMVRRGELLSLVRQERAHVRGHAVTELQVEDESLPEVSAA